MTLPACLVTSTPSYEDRQRTRPFLLSETAKPDPRPIMVVDIAPPKDKASYDFEVGVVSEDAGDKVFGQLVFDYGFQAEGGLPNPYRDMIGNGASIDPATIDDPPRSLRATWNVVSDPPTTGCHNIALLATHEFYQQTACPVDPADFDYVMWTLIVCDSSMGPPCCDPTAPPNQGGCSIQCPDIDANVTTVRCGQSAGDSQ